MGLPLAVTVATCPMCGADSLILSTVVVLAAVWKDQAGTGYGFAGEVQSSGLDRGGLAPAPLLLLHLCCTAALVSPCIQAPVQQLSLCWPSP